jgi:EpsI family protein
LPVAGAPGGRLNANLVLIEEGGRRYAIAYWYQIGQAPLASDHWYRVRLLYNRIVHGRTDGALIRMASPVASGEDPAVVVARYARFLGVFYPELLRRLPG